MKISITPKDFRCKQCGNCCLTLGDAFQTCATDEDIHLWKEEGRDDSYKRADPKMIGVAKYVYNVRVGPTTGTDVQKCPKLRKLLREIPNVSFSGTYDFIN